MSRFTDSFYLRSANLYDWSKLAQDQGQPEQQSADPMADLVADPSEKVMKAPSTISALVALKTAEYRRAKPS